MKKYFCVAVAAAIIICSTFIGCGDNSKSVSSADNSDSTTAVSDTDALATDASSSVVSSSSDTSTSTVSSVSSAESDTAVDEEFFADAVFVGDSLTEQMRVYVDYVVNTLEKDCILGKAKFICSDSLSFANSLWDINAKSNVHPTYQGEKYLVQDGVAATGRKKVFIMMGINDVGTYGVKSTITHAKQMINNILSKTPDAKIYIQSVTPIVNTCVKGDYNNKNVQALNDELIKLCSENNWQYLDVASVLKDSDGSLIYDYCYDPDPKECGIHLKNKGLVLWLDYLKENVK